MLAIILLSIAILSAIIGMGCARIFMGTAAKLNSRLKSPAPDMKAENEAWNQWCRINDKLAKAHTKFGKVALVCYGLGMSASIALLKINPLVSGLAAVPFGQGAAWAILVFFTAGYIIASLDCENHNDVSFNSWFERRLGLIWVSA